MFEECTDGLELMFFGSKTRMNGQIKLFRNHSQTRQIDVKIGLGKALMNQFRCVGWVTEAKPRTFSF